MIVDSEAHGDEKYIVDPRIMDADGKDSLHIAIERGSPIELVSKLLDR